MQFCQFVTAGSAIKRAMHSNGSAMPVDSLYALMMIAGGRRPKWLEGLIATTIGSAMVESDDASADRQWRNLFRYAAEWLWWRNGRPYYNVWPSIKPCLQAMNCDAVPPESYLNVPEKVLAIQFNSESNPQVIKGSMQLGDRLFGLTRSVLVASVTRSDLELMIDESVSLTRRLNRRTALTHALMIDLDWSAILVMVIQLNIIRNGGHVSDDKYMTLSMPLVFWNTDSIGCVSCPATLSGVLNVARSVLLMERSPQLFEPDVLQRDQCEYDMASDDERRLIVERAFIKRAQRGYHVGRSLESVPHVRRPHPAIVWTGSGRRTAKVVFRSGSVVHRKKLTETPTGYHGSFGEAECDKC